MQSTNNAWLHVENCILHERTSMTHKLRCLSLGSSRSRSSSGSKCSERKRTVSRGATFIQFIHVLQKVEGRKEGALPRPTALNLSGFNNAATKRTFFAVAADTTDTRGRHKSFWHFLQFYEWKFKFLNRTRRGKKKQNKK